MVHIPSDFVQMNTAINNLALQPVELVSPDLNPVEGIVRQARYSLAAIARAHRANSVAIL